MEWNTVKRAIKTENRHKNRIKRSGQAWLVYVTDINRNIPSTWRWAPGGSSHCSTLPLTKAVQQGQDQVSPVSLKWIWWKKERWFVSIQRWVLSLHWPVQLLSMLEDNQQFNSTQDGTLLSPVSLKRIWRKKERWFVSIQRWVLSLHWPVQLLSMLEDNQQFNSTQDGTLLSPVSRNQIWRKKEMT